MVCNSMGNQVTELKAKKNGDLQTVNNSKYIF
ncbi:MAG: hypothetical protein JWQ63_1587 [Mucilaginibacter sp.]|nr:hypothetical protein [Mucilaginibacter sp.]